MFKSTRKTYGDFSSHPSATKASRQSSAPLIVSPAAVALCVPWEACVGPARAVGFLVSFRAWKDVTAMISADWVLFVSNISSRTRLKKAISSAVWVVAIWTSSSEAVLI